jgi:hypothetical protein
MSGVCCPTASHCSDMNVNAILIDVQVECMHKWVVVVGKKVEPRVAWAWLRWMCAGDAATCMYKTRPKLVQNSSKTRPKDLARSDPFSMEYHQKPLYFDRFL